MRQYDFRSFYNSDRLCRDYHLIHAAKPVRNPESAIALIHVSLSATLDHALPVAIWDRLSPVSAEKRYRQDDVSIQNTTADGVVAKCAVMSFLAGNILATEDAMKAYAAVVRSQSIRVAFVAE